jgi:hypothetical protein
MPLKYHYAILTELIDDLMLVPARMKQMMEMHHDLFNFLKVNILFHVQLDAILVGFADTIFNSAFDG